MHCGQPSQTSLRAVGAPSTNRNINAIKVQPAAVGWEKASLSGLWESRVSERESRQYDAVTTTPCSAVCTGSGEIP
jgi:hypothetical protein